MTVSVTAAAVNVQAVIGNYAVPILEDKQVWGTNDDSRTAYMDTQVRRKDGCWHGSSNSSNSRQAQGSTNSSW